MLEGSAETNKSIKTAATLSLPLLYNILLFIVLFVNSISIVVVVEEEEERVSTSFSRPLSRRRRPLLAALSHQFLPSRRQTNGARGRLRSLLNEENNQFEAMKWARMAKEHARPLFASIQKKTLLYKNIVSIHICNSESTLG